MRYYLAVLIIVLLQGCAGTYYDAMEKVGIHKRDILVDRIEAVQESQKESKVQFVSALEELKGITQFDGGDLEENYQRLQGAFEDSEDAANTISERIANVENVAEHLFEEWEEELGQYTSTALKNDSRNRLNATKRRYGKLLRAMRSAEKRIDPVINTLRDHVLYLKHNLNARAISSLKTELERVQVNITRLVSAMEESIRESDQFINELRKS